MDCLFCKIIEGQIPSTKIYENDDMLIIKDINPQAKIHYLLLPKGHYADVGEIALNNPHLLGRCLAELARIADSLGLENGYRLVTNKGEDGCQSVHHVHIHIMGGEKLSDRMG